MSTGFQFGATNAADNEKKSFSFGSSTAPTNNLFGAVSSNSANTNKPLFGAPSTTTSTAETSFKPIDFGGAFTAGKPFSSTESTTKTDTNAPITAPTTTAPSFSFSTQPTNPNSAGQSFSFTSKPTSDEPKSSNTPAISFKIPESSSESRSDGQSTTSFSFSMPSLSTGDKQTETKKDDSKPMFSTNSFSFGSFGVKASEASNTQSATSTATTSLFSAPSTTSASASLFSTPSTTSGTSAPSAFTFSGATQSENKSSGFSFGNTSTLTSTSAISTTQDKSKDSLTLTGSTSTDIKALPAEYMGKTVEEIINMWSEQLERNAETFTKEAVKVSSWDMNLMEAQKNLGDIANDVRRIQVGQKELDANLDTISAYQMELNSTLSQLEKSVEKMYAAQDQMPTAADIEREKTLQLSINIDEELSEMTESLKETVQELNQTQNQMLDENNPVTQIMKILNVHHNSLRWIEANAKNMNSEIEQLSKKLSTASLR